MPRHKNITFQIQLMHQLFIKTQRRSVHQYIQVSSLTKNICAISLNKAPVNTLNLEMMREISDAVHALERQDDCKSVIFMSNLKVFCAGFDINEFWKPNLKRLESFWEVAHKLALTVKKSSMVTASAINGHCVAGGCIFPFLSDISVMSNNGGLRIGLSATRMGIVPPDMLLIPMQNLVGHRKTEMLASLSTMLTPKEASKLKLIQTITDDKKVLPTTVQLVESYFEIPEMGRVATKRYFNQSLLNKLDNEERIMQEVKGFAQHILKPEIQKLIENHLQSIKKR